MPDVYFQTPASFPQISQNRTRALAAEELCDYIGGGDRPEARVRAGRAWDAAVREFNSVGWRFNRTSQQITLAAGIKEYTLNSDFRSPVRCSLQDSDSNNQYPLCWIPYEVWYENFYPQSASGGTPNYYTARNVHDAGLVRFEPWPSGGNLAYPTAQIVYLRRILLASADSDRLNVPVEVDEAIFQLAAAILSDRERNASEVGDRFIRAKVLRLDCEREHRDFGEVTGWGANG